MSTEDQRKPLSDSDYKKKFVLLPIMDRISIFRLKVDRFEYVYTDKAVNVIMTTPEWKKSGLLNPKEKLDYDHGHKTTLADVIRKALHRYDQALDTRDMNVIIEDGQFCVNWIEYLFMVGAVIENKEFIEKYRTSNEKLSESKKKIEQDLETARKQIEELKVIKAKYEQLESDFNALIATCPNCGNSMSDTLQGKVSGI